jgi:hypothetical protein
LQCYESFSNEIIDGSKARLDVRGRIVCRRVTHVASVLRDLPETFELLKNAIVGTHKVTESLKVTSAITGAMAPFDRHAVKFEMHVYDVLAHISNANDGCIQKVPLALPKVRRSRPIFFDLLTSETKPRH